MALSEKAHRRLLWAGAVAVILIVRVGWVLYERSRPFPHKSVVKRPIDRDQLVVVPKFYVDDFVSAKQLVGKTIWVKLGYVTGYFADNSRVKTDRRDVRYFEPLESVSVEKVLERPIAGEAGSKEVFLGFQREGSAWLTLVGVYNAPAERYEMRLDELFYVKNPRELYPHWDKSAWNKIERHALEAGMTLAQVLLSMGFGRLVTTEAGGAQLYEFTRKPGGEPGKVRVRFVDGRVKEIQVSK